MDDKNSKLLRLLEACKQGKRSAQKELFEMYKGRMFAVCMRYAKNREEAEDMMIEGFCKIFSSLGTYTFKGSFEGWMHKIVVYTAINTYYANIRHNKNAELEEYTEDKEFEIQNIAPVEYDVLLDLVQELPEDQRIVFNMVAIDDYPVKTVAESLDFPLGHVKKLYEKAAEHLRAKIAELTK